MGGGGCLSPHKSLGMDLSIAVSVLPKRSLQVGGTPFTTTTPRTARSYLRVQPFAR